MVLACSMKLAVTVQSAITGSVVNVVPINVPPQPLTMSMTKSIKLFPRGNNFSYSVNYSANFVGMIVIFSAAISVNTLTVVSAPSLTPYLSLSTNRHSLNFENASSQFTDV